MTGALCRVGSALKKDDPSLSVKYMPGAPGSFGMSTKETGCKLYSFYPAFFKPSSAVAMLQKQRAGAAAAQ